MSEDAGVTNGDSEGAMPGLEVPNWCEGCAGCQALRKELQDKEAEHKRVWLAVKQRVISTDLLLKQNAEYKARYNAKAQECDIQRQKIEEATRQLAATERHCETLQMQLDSALKEMEPLKKRTQELEENQQRCKTEVEEARDRIRASEGLCQQYREVIKKFEDEEAEREANNSSEKKVSAAKLQEDLTKLKADLASERRKSRGLARELDKAKVMIDGLQEQNSKVQQQAGEPGYIPVVTPAKQPKISHVTRTRTPKRNLPPPASAMGCSNTPDASSDEEEEVDWSNVAERGVLSPVMPLSPLSPLPPTPAPCRRDDRFSSSSDSSDDNSDMDDDADRIENELLGGTQTFSDTDVVDDKVNDAPKLSPVKNNSHNGPYRPPKQSPTVNVTKENRKAQVKQSPRDRVNSPKKLTRSQVQSRDRRRQVRPPVRRAAKAKVPLTEERLTPPIESAQENDCQSWFGEVEDLSDSESDSSPEKDKGTETKAKNGAEDFASPPRMARLRSTASEPHLEDDTAEEQNTTITKLEVPISPPKTRKTTGATPSRYPLRSRSGDSSVKQEQNGDVRASPRKKNKSESDACDLGKKLTSPTRAQYELRSRQDNKTDKIGERIEAENTKDKTDIVNKSNDTMQEQIARKDSHGKEEKPADIKKLNNSIAEEGSDKGEDVKLQSKEEDKVSSGLVEVCSSQVENKTIDSESKISSPPHVGLLAAPSVNKEPSNIITKAESDREGKEKPRSDSPEFRRPLTRSLSHSGKVNSGGRRDSSSSDREGDVSPKRVTRLQTKLVSPLAGPSARTRDRSSSSEKSLSDVDTKDIPSNSNPPKKVTRLQTKLISPLAGPSSRTRSRSSSSEKSLSDVDAKDNPPKHGTPRRLNTKSETASLSSSEKKTNTDSQKSVPKSVLPPKKSAKDLRTKDISGDRDSQGNVSDKETCPAQKNVRPALDITPEKPVPKTQALNNSTCQISKEEAVGKSPEVSATATASKRLAVNKVAVVVLEPLEKPSQQKTASQRHVPEEQQHVGQSGESCTGEVASTKNKVTVDKQVVNAHEIPDEARKEGLTCTNDNVNQQIPEEAAAKADGLPEQARQSSASIGSNLEAPKEQESACDTMEEGELSESETEATNSLQGSGVSVLEHQGPAELGTRHQPSVSLPERVSPQVSNRSSRSSLSTSPVSPLPPSPFESLALSPLPVSPLLLEAPISPLPPSPWRRSASPSLSPSLPISPLRETPLPPVVSPLQRTPHGEDGSSQTSKDAASPNTENPPHPSPCVFRSVAPKGAVQVKPKANRGRGAARSLSMGGKDSPSQNALNNSSKKRANLFVQSEKTAWRSGKKSMSIQDKQKSTTKGNSRPTTLPIKPNSQQLKTKPVKASTAINGQERVRDGATCSQNGQDIMEEATTTSEEGTRQTVKHTEKGKIKTGHSLALQDEEKEKQTSGMSSLKKVDPHERIEEEKTNESQQVPDSNIFSAAEDTAVPKDVSGTSKRSLEEDVEDGEITGDESDEEGMERRTVKKLKTDPRDRLTADHVLQYMNNVQGGVTVPGAVNIIMEYLLLSEEARADLFPKVKTMCETGNTKLPVMTTAEMAILGRVTYLAKFGQWEGLVGQVSHALSAEIRRNVGKEHLLATCRLYTGLCRLRGNLEQVRILVYDILREKLFYPADRILTIVSVWPLVLQRSSPALEDGPMSHVIELVLMSGDMQEDLKSCFRSLYQWKDVKEGDVNSLAERLVELLQRKETAALVTSTARVKYPCLNPLMYETAKALELLASHQGWRWTHDYLVRTLLLPLLQKWRDNKVTSRPRSIKIRSTVPHGTVVAIMQVIGCVGRIGLAEDKSSLNQLQQVMIDLLAEAVETPNSVPWGIQIAAASSLVQLSPSNPGHALTALQAWMNLPRRGLCVCPPLLKQNVETLARCCR